MTSQLVKQSGREELPDGRSGRLAIAASIALLVLVACSSSATQGTGPALPTGSRSTAAADWPTYHRDPSRSGYDPTASRATGRLAPAWHVDLDGAVYAEPLVIGGTVVVATEADTLYGIRAGRVAWRRPIGRPAPLSTLPCGNIDPLGITGTPVYDRGTGLVYAVARLTAPDRHLLVAVDPDTGAVRWRRSADPPGARVRYEQQRGALTVAGGRVWVVYGGLDGDCGPYHGYVVGAPVGGGGAALAVYRTPSAREAGIWAPPGPVVDASGHLYVAVGNGASTGGRYDQSDSVLELSGTRVLSYFAPSAWARENAADLDLGSQGPALLGDYVFIAGKSGTVYTLRAGRLGGVGGQVDMADVCRSFGGTATYRNIVYVPCTDGVRAVAVSRTGRISPVWAAASGIGGSPVLGGGAVWALDTDAGRLHQLDPRSGHSVASAAVGPVSRFATPTLAGDLVIVGTLSGVVALTGG